MTVVRIIIYSFPDATSLQKQLDGSMKDGVHGQMWGVGTIGVVTLPTPTTWWLLLRNMWKLYREVKRG